MSLPSQFGGFFHALEASKGNGMGLYAAALRVQVCTRKRPIWNIWQGACEGEPCIPAIFFPFKSFVFLPFLSQGVLSSGEEGKLWKEGHRNIAEALPSYDGRLLWPLEQ